jgi:N-carbamoyl-L-amino-acid hydrolase
MSRIGATGRGGVNRQALTAEDAQARKLLLACAAQRGYSASIDPIGNLFIRRPGSQPHLSPVLAGSHLDSQPKGGNFDGVFGVLATFETLEALDDAGFMTCRPVELVVWMNEEGSRFPPATMGSGVLAGRLSLQEALAVTDRSSISVRTALGAHRGLLPPLTERALNPDAFAYLEAHIEQGPVLEEKGLQIGIVTGIQGLSMLQVTVRGEEAHAGTTPLRARRDAFVAATSLVQALREIASDPTDTLRFTVGRFEVSPGSPNTIPSQVYFTIDLRHPDEKILAGVADQLFEVCNRTEGSCIIEAQFILRSSPTEFDKQIVKVIRDAADILGFAHMDMISGATHDAKFIAEHCPTAMIFIPCKGGISHNEAESARREDLIAGAEVLCAAIQKLAMSSQLEQIPVI